MFLTIIVTLYTLNSKFSPLRFPFFVLFSTLKYKSGQNRAFLVFSSLKIGRSFCSNFGAVSMVFLPDFPGSYAMQYNRTANFTARTTKNFPKLQKKFPEVPEKISRGSMKSFGLCHEIISPVILKSFGLSQDLPLSQNGQNRRREKIGSKGLKRIDGANGPSGAKGKWAWP